MKHSCFHVSATICSACMLLPGQSQANTQETVVPMLEPVVITSVAPSSPLMISTNPKLPRQPLPASDGTDYLKTIPGFAAIRNGGTNGDPILRGMFGSRLNVLTNGSSMPGACPGRMDAPSSYISPENFDALTVIKGPQTVLWGPGASAGTVKFDRDTPRFTKSEVRFDGSLTAGSFGRNDQAADLTVGNETFYVRATANRSHSDDYKDGDHNTIASRWDKWNADLTLGFTPDQDTLLELTAGVGDGKARYAGRGMDGSQFKRESLGLKFEKSNIGPFLNKIEAQLYYNYADHVMDNYTLRTPDPRSSMRMPMASNVDRATWSGRVAATFAIAQNTDLVTGIDWQHSRHRARSGTAMHSYRDKAWEKDAEFGNLGLFGEATWHATQRDRLIAGLRIDWASVKDFRQTTGMMKMINPTAGQRRRGSLPSGFLRYEKDLQSVPASVYVGIGHVTRFPDYWELFSPRKGPDGSVNAFQGVQPEKTTQLDIGAQYKNDHLQAWVSAYAGYVQDFILFDYQTGGMMGSTTMARNVNASIMGAESGFTYQLNPSWQIGSTLAYAWGRNWTDGGPLPQIPPLEAKLTLSYENGPWSAGALWRLVASQHRIAMNKGNVVGKDFGQSSGFGVLSLNTSYAFSKQVKFTVGIDNVLNKQYSEHLNLAGNAGFGFPSNTRVSEPGRSAWAQLNLQF